MIRHFFHPSITTTILLLIFGLTTTTLAQEDDSIVYDTYGEPLKPGQNYYLIPTAYTDNGGGGVKPLSFGSRNCPSKFYVSNEKENTNFGDPIVFTTRSRKIFLSNRLQISFPNFPPTYVTCRKAFPKIWGITEYNSTYVVEVNGDATRGPWFTIEDAQDGNYLISICVTWDKCGGLSYLNDVYDKPALGVNFTNPTSFVFEPNSWSSPKPIKSSRLTQATM